MKTQFIRWAALTVLSCTLAALGGNSVFANPRVAVVNDTTYFRFSNHTDCNLGDVVFHFASSPDVTINVPGSGTFESTEIRLESSVSVTVLGETYLLSSLPTSISCDPGIHVLSYIAATHSDPTLDIAFNTVIR